MSLESVYLKSIEILNTEREDRSIILEAANNLLNASIEKGVSFLQKDFFSRTGNEDLFKEIAKSAEILMFSYEDNELQSIGAKIFALCFGINHTEMYSTCESYIEKMRDPSTILTDKWSIISSLAETIVVSNFEDFKHDKKVAELIETMFSLIVDIIGTPQSNPSDTFLRYQACRVIVLYIDICKDKFIKVPNPQQFLEAVSVSLSIPNLDLFEECHNLMLSFAKVFCLKDTPFMNTIFNYTKQCITNDYHDERFNMISIEFWGKICYIKETSSVKNMDDLPVNKLSELFYNILLSIDPNDTEIEDPQNNPKPSIKATIAMASLFDCYPSEVFAFVKEKLEGLLSNDLWTAKHTFCLLLYIISRQTQEMMPFSAYRFIVPYFKPLCLLMKSNIPRLRETSMYTVSYVIRKYPIFILGQEEQHDIINDIISYLFTEEMPINETTHPTIIIRIISVLSSIVTSYGPNAFDNQIVVGSDIFQTITARIMDIIKLKLDDKTIFIHAYSCLNNLNLHAQKDVPGFIDIIEKDIATIKEIKDSNENDTIKSYMISGTCSNISSAIFRVGTDIESMYSEIIELVFQLLEMNNNFISKEAILVAWHAINNTTNKEDIVKFTEFAINYINSNDSELVENASIFLSNVFIKFRSDLNSYYDDLVLNIEALIANEEIYVKCKPFLIKTLSDIIDSIGGLQQELADKYRDHLYKILVYYRDLEYPTENREERDLTYEFLNAVANGFRVFGHLFFVKDLERTIEKGMLNDICKVSSAIIKAKCYDTDVLGAALDMFMEYTHNCSRKNNVTLNRSINYMIIDRAMKINILSRKAREVRRIMGNT